MEDIYKMRKIQGLQFHLNLLCFNIIYTRIIQSILKKSELRKLISDYNSLKLKSKKYNVSEKLKEIEHKYYHETGRNLFDDIS